MAKKGLDGRTRDEDGEIHKKRADTELGTLRKTYPGLLPGERSDKTLGTIRKEHGDKSLSQIVKKGK